MLSDGAMTFCLGLRAGMRFRVPAVSGGYVGPEVELVELVADSREVENRQWLVRDGEGREATVRTWWLRQACSRL